MAERRAQLLKQYVIRFVGLANGRQHAYSGMFLASYDVNWVHPEHGYDGGLLDVTPFISEAMKFAAQIDALTVWKAQAPPPYETRPDGQPNRPLTAFTIEVLPYEEKRHKG